MRKETSAAKMMGWVSPGHAKLNGTVLHIFACYKPLSRKSSEKKNTSKKSCKSSGKVQKILVFQNADAFHDRKSKTTEDHPTMYAV